MTRVLERPAYRGGGLMRAGDYARGQAYLAELQAIRSRSLHLWGIADGLEVTVQPDKRRAVTVSPGMALDAAGRQIVIDRPMTVDLSAVTAWPVYLTAAVSVQYGDWRKFPQAGGDTRAADTAVLALETAPQDTGVRVMLARLTVAPEGRLTAPDPSVRRYCGLRSGHLLFPRPDLAAEEQPRIDMVHDPLGRRLVVSAARTDLFGSLSVAGRVSVGAAPADAAAAFAVQAEPQIRALGPVTVVAGSLAVAEDAGDLAKLRAGDMITIGDETLRITRRLGRRALALASAPSRKIRDISSRDIVGTVAWIKTGDLADALWVRGDGAVGIGCAPEKGKAGWLAVGSGDIRLDDGAVLSFLEGGVIRTGDDDDHALSFAPDPRPVLAIRETGEIAFFSRPTKPGEPPGLVATRTGRVGIGVAVVGSTLTVNGVIRAEDGLIFPDGTTQKDAVSDLPIGAVIDWWRPDGVDQNWSRPGFQLCDGSEIDDPASPLHGKTTPNLSELFVRGVVDIQGIGTTGGLPDHAHFLAAHTHSIQHRHPIQGQTAEPDLLASADPEEFSISAKSHTHLINVESGGTTADRSGPPEREQSAANPVKTLTASNLPRYMDLLKVMRIK